MRGVSESPVSAPASDEELFVLRGGFRAGTWLLAANDVQAGLEALDHRRHLLNGCHSFLRNVEPASSTTSSAPVRM